MPNYKKSVLAVPSSSQIVKLETIGNFHVAYFIISDIFQDIVLINNSCYWKMKDNCASAGLASFLADKVTPTFLLLHTDYHYPQDFASGTLGT